MKRILSTMFLCFIITGTINAQLLVDENGHVGVKVSGQSVNSLFSVNSSGDSQVNTYILSNNISHDIALRVLKREEVSTNHNYIEGILSSAKLDVDTYRYGYGLFGQAYREGAIDTSNGRSYGVFGLAGNSTSGWNFGVFGTLYGNNNGAGVFGSSENYDVGINTQGKFAGFFHGDVKSTNNIYASNFLTTSDFRLKKNIEPIEPEIIDKLMNLNVVKYNLKQRFVEMGDTTTIPVSYYVEDSEIYDKTHYGLIAQELLDIYPNLVNEGQDGYLSVNYVELVPILIGFIQELKSEVDYLKKESDKVSYRVDATTKVTDLGAAAFLSQNNPNPFTENTTISCFVPFVVKNADLYIYDMNGRQIDSRKIGERGEVAVTIEGKSFDAGIYLYSLITDGVVIDTKRMILTK